MHKISVTVVAVFMLALSTAASAQGGAPPSGQSRENSERQPDMRGRAMGMEEHQAGLDFQRQMHERELQEQRAQAEGHRPWEHRGHPGGAIFLGICLIVHILLTVWVYQDMHQRNAGSGLWIPIVLLSGFFGALLYALARLGDMRQQGT